MRDILDAAQRICSGAAYRDNLNAEVEIVSGGRLHRIPSWRYQQHVSPLVNAAATEYLAPHGYCPPLDVETQIGLREFLERRWKLMTTGQEGPTYTRVLFFLNARSGCSYWRCEEPARILAQEPGFYVDVTEQLDYEWALHFDVIVVQRGLFATKSGGVFTTLDALREAGKKIVYEIDDDLDHIPMGNSVYFSLEPRERRLINWLREVSDGIICSTATLRDVLGLPDKTHVLVNSLDFSRYQGRAPEEESFIHVNWHGGESHQVDIDHIGKELHEFLKTRRPALEDKTGKKIIFSAFGYFPLQLSSYITRDVAGSITTHNEYHLFSDPLLKKTLKESFPDDKMHFIIKGQYDTRYVKAVDVKDFHQKLVDLQPDICICPLVPDMPFNASKSNIKWIESTLAGAACVVTEMSATLNGQPLRGPFDDIPDECVLKARTPAQMFQGVQELIVNPTKRRALWEASNKYVRTHYDLRQNISLWAEALTDIARSK